MRTRTALISGAMAALAGAGLRGEPATYAGRVAPILEQHCVVCHGPEKQKAKLRLDSHAAILAGSKEGPVLTPGNTADSELLRRVKLPATDDDVMPSDGKPTLDPVEIAVLEKWIAAGASETAEFDAPALVKAVVEPPAAPDYTSRLAQARELAQQLGMRLMPRSRVVTDGLVLRTASSPGKGNDAALAALAPVADLIVEAELARTKVTDAGMKTVAGWANLRRLDLSHTAVTSAGLGELKPLGKLSWINLTATQVDEAGVAALRERAPRATVWAFEEKPGPVPPPPPPVKEPETAVAK